MGCPARSQSPIASFSDASASRPWSASYAYSGDGVRLSKTVNGTNTTYLQDVVGGLPRVLVETTAGQDTLYVYGLGLAFEVRPDGTHRYYHGDALGSTRVVTDDGGQRRGG